jgi:hypothetical protein
VVTRRPCHTKIGWSLLSGHGDKTKWPTMPGESPSVSTVPHPATAQRRKGMCAARNLDLVCARGLQEDDGDTIAASSVDDSDRPLLPR